MSINTPENWRKSSYSDGSGGNCLEVSDRWWKSSHSSGDGGNCLEVSGHFPAADALRVRDSKTAVEGGDVLAFSASAWTAFVAALKP
ncbi:hypothetical protein DSC45_06175 [Streptomyces sp. YIM 130001]|uniref:DUF397 domain-containing protein n=1 Tax=Streptomyces sp. YIM 130001 TaxID=2259644 RepID=UPI000E6533C5|nr:DUF397 domain-containing protein [Streptomyces sp. YIM 130001]RII19581.1 hypothetical protein DSC45_06175 [Streptomyces sp. YIM 130001]